MSEHCGCSSQPVASSVQQTLDELDFERGIWSAALEGDKARVNQLLLKGTNVNSRDNAGYTALHYAARKGNVEVCKLLLASRADVNAVTRAGQATALHRAAMAGHLDVVHLLLHSGADLHRKDADGLTALDRAKANKHIDVVKILQEN